MKRFSVNLASRPFRNNAVYWAAFTLCFAALAAGTWYNVRLFSSTGKDLLELQARLLEKQEAFEALSAEVEEMTRSVAQVDLKALDERSGFANEILLGRLFSWTQLFDRLEQVQPENVRIRSIRPSIGRQGIEITVDAMAKDYDNVLAFEEGLLDSDYFTFVYPIQESSRETQNEINFNLIFGYVPGGKPKPPAPPEPAVPPASEEGAAAEEAAPEEDVAPDGGEAEEDEDALDEEEGYEGDGEDEEPEEETEEPGGPGPGGGP